MYIPLFRQLGILYHKNCFFRNSLRFISTSCYSLSWLMSEIVDLIWFCLLFVRGRWNRDGQRSKGPGEGQKAGSQYQHAQGTTRGIQRGTDRDQGKYGKYEGCLSFWTCCKSWLYISSIKICLIKSTDCLKYI